MCRIKYFKAQFYHLCLVFLLLHVAQIRAAVPALERNVSLSVKNEAVISILTKIQDQSGVIFSYSPLLFKDASTVSLQVKNKSVREVLSLILPSTIQFKAKNNYIILKEKELAKNTKSQEVSGYVYDAGTEKKLAHVTVYDKQSLESTITDEYGYYSIQVPVNQTSLSVNRINYEDTAIILQNKSDQNITNISLQAKPDSISNKDSVLWKKTMSQITAEANVLLKKFNNYIHSINVKDSLEREYQFSALPFIGSNHKLSANVYNRYSFNILGGYSRGTKALEVGGLFNIDRENVTGTQLAGLFNLVGDSLRGFQAAGLFNLNGKKTKGVQLSTCANLNGGTVEGVQLCGLVNLNDYGMHGLQMAGIMNFNKLNNTGVSLAGLMNINAHSSGVHVAGLMNIQDSSDAVLCAGLFNVSQTSETNYEIAGLFNYLEHGESRLQISSLLNRTEKLRGVQIGLLNFADSASGLPIGLISIVKNGLHQVEISGDEVQYFNLNFRTGVPYFYNIFYGGISPHSNDLLWSFGYGLGSSIQFSKKWSAEVQASSKHLSLNSFNSHTSERLQIYLGVEYKLKKKVAIAIGPCLNWYLSETDQEINNPDYTKLFPSYSTVSLLDGGLQSRFWTGFQISLRFF